MMTQKGCKENMNNGQWFSELLIQTITIYNKNTILDPNEVDFKKVDIKTYTEYEY